MTHIDRLARSLSDLRTIVTALKAKGAHLGPVRTKAAFSERFSHGVENNNFLSIVATCNTEHKYGFYKRLKPKERFSVPYILSFETTNLTRSRTPHNLASGSAAQASFNIDRDISRHVPDKALASVDWIMRGGPSLRNIYFLNAVFANDICPLDLVVFDRNGKNRAFKVAGLCGTVFNGFARATQIFVAYI